MNEAQAGADGAPQGEITSASSDGAVAHGAVVVAPMSKEHAAGHAELAKIRAGMADRTAPEQRAQDWKKLTELHRHVFDKGAKPSWYLPDQQPPADMREWGGGLEAKLEAEAQPITAEISDRLLARTKVQGVAPHVAETGVEICRSLGLDEAASSTIMSRISKHYSAGGMDGEGFIPLDQSETAEFAGEAARLMGGNDKLQAASERARQFLEHKGLLADLDKSGATKSSLAFDPRVINALAFAADHAGLPRK
jgi:hypothetical protein